MGKLTIGNMTRNIAGIPSKVFNLQEIVGSPTEVDSAQFNTFIDDASNHIGADHIHYKAKNLTGSIITNGTIVSFAGTIEDDDILRVKPYATGEVAIGIVQHDIPHGEVGLVVNTGRFDGYNTIGYSTFTILYPTNGGGLTHIKPTHGLYQACAIVLKKAGGTGGSLLVEFTEPNTVQHVKAYKAFTATEGQTVYTDLGWTIPQASTASLVSVAVYVEGSRKVPGLDFTHTTDTITLTTGVSAGTSVYIEEL
jgi:hypothetical protein